MCHLKGMEILISEDLARIKPTAPLRLVNQATRRIETDSIPPTCQYPGQMSPDEYGRQTRE